MEISFDCSTVVSSKKTTGAGVDFIENDTTLANLSTEEFFQNYTGYSTSDYKSLKVDQIVSSAPEITSGGIYWVDSCYGCTSNFKLNGGTFGCSIDHAGLVATYQPISSETKCEDEGGNLEPIIMVVDGDFDMTGGTIYGAVIVLGDFKGGGGGDVVGAMMINGDADKGVGNIRVWYNSTILESVDEDESPFATSGGWRDFE